MAAKIILFNAFRLKNLNKIFQPFVVMLRFTMTDPNQMVSRATEGVNVSVESFYQPDYSNPVNGEFMFAYRVTIANNNPFPVKLLRRHWYIFDSNASQREVEGEGVVGIQPQINPGEQYQYISGCNLRTEMGKMHGTYLMQNLANRDEFRVNIPVFHMVVPFKMN
jgi:ApaG protein